MPRCSSAAWDRSITLTNDSAKLFAGAYALYCGVVFIATAGLVLAPVGTHILHRFHLDKDLTLSGTTGNFDLERLAAQLVSELHHVAALASGWAPSATQLSPLSSIFNANVSAAPILGVDAS